MEVVQEGEFSSREETATFTKTPSDDEGSEKENQILVQSVSENASGTTTQEIGKWMESKSKCPCRSGYEWEEKLDYLKQSMQQ